MERQPTIDPSQNVPVERTTPREADKPVPAESPSIASPSPAADSDGSATNLQAPQLFDPNDRTAQRHMAPVWTAVYHTTSGAGTDGTARLVATGPAGRRRLDQRVGLSDSN